MIDERPAFLRSNVFDGATIDAESNEATGYPVADILKRRHDLPYRSNDAAPTIHIETPAPVSVNALLFRFPSERDPDVTPDVPVGPADTIRIRAGSAQGLGDLLDVTVGSGHHLRLGYSGHVLFASDGAINTVTSQFWQFTITASGSPFVELENIWAGDLWFPGFKVNRQSNFGIEEEAEIGRAAFTGGAFAEARSRLLRFNGVWSVWTEQELDDWEEFALSHGTTKPFVLFRKLTGDLSKRVSISQFDRAVPIVDQDGAHFTVSASFKENR